MLGDMDAIVPTAEALDAAVHRIRHIARPEVPYAATRGTLHEDETVLLVDTSTLTEWAGWRCAGSQHLLAPLDVVRHAEGHEVVLPDVRESVARACGRREAAGVGWRRGEAVTLLVSLVRGVAEAAAIGVIDGEGEWWIAVDGRPMFAFAEGAGESIVAASRVLVDRVASQIDDRVLARAIDDVCSALDHPDTLAHRLDDVEEPLFDAAAPQPIQSDDLGGDGTPRPGRVIAFDAAETDGRLAWLRDAIDRHIDSSLGEALRDAISSLSARLAQRRERATYEKDRRGRHEKKRRAASRGARWPLVIVGSAAAAVVVAAGMLWPAGAPDARAREREPDPMATQTEQAGDPGRTEPPEESEQPTPADPAPTLDAVAAAREILAAWDACGEACRAPHGVERSGAAARGDRAVSLVDDYGAVVLLEIAAPEADRQLLVIERSDEGWRVRDLYAAPE